MEIFTESLVSRPTPAESFESLFPSLPRDGFYLDENEDEIFYSILPDREPPLDQITRYSESELTQLAKLISEDHKFYLSSLSPSELKAHIFNEHAFGIRITPSKTSTLASMAQRLVSQKWWRRNINRLADERREHLAQIEKRIGRRTNQQCCSDATVAVMRARRIKTISYLQNTYKVMSNTVGLESPTVFSLFDVAKAQHVNRINELYLDIKALEKIAEERGWGWMFVTLTAAPKYHSNPAVGNNSYEPALNARAANKSIAEDWKAIRGALKERGFKPGNEYFGFRVTEVHDDGCPHWHILFFHDDGALKIVEEAIERLYRDRPKNYFVKNKQNIVKVGRKRGEKDAASPASYIYNYIVYALSGSLDGDFDSSVAFRYRCALRAMGARQFQLFGIKGARGKLRALIKVKKQGGCPENLLLLANEVHSDRDVENRNEKQLEARVKFFLGGADSLELHTECAMNGFGEIVEKPTEIRHREDSAGVRIYGLCEAIDKTKAEAIDRKSVV